MKERKREAFINNGEVEHMRFACGAFGTGADM